MDYFGKPTDTGYKHSKKTSPQQLNWLFVDMNSYFASVEQQLNPRLRGRPVGVVPMMAETTCCLAASYEAKKYGIKTGTPVYEARKRCPAIQFVVADHKRYMDFHDQIVEAVERCLPVNKIMSVDEMACRLTGRDQRLENAIALAKEVKSSILDIGTCLTSSVGIAPSRFLSKVASDMQKPDGLTVILPQDIPHKLFQLKPRDFPGIGPRMEERLLRYGISTVEQLYKLDPHQMRAVWGGVVGERYYGWLRGEDLEHQFEEGKSIGHSHVLAPEMRTQDGAYRIAIKLLHKVAYRLRLAECLTKEISLGLLFMDKTHWREHIKVSPTQDTHSLNDAFQILWKRRPRYTPLKVSINLTNFISEKEQTLSFFDDERKKQASRAMDKINNKYKKHMLYLADMHESKDLAKDTIAFSSLPESDLD